MLATARAIPGTGWALVYKIDRAEALAGTEARLRRLTIGFLLAMAVVVVALFAMWRMARLCCVARGVGAGGARPA